MVCVGGVERPAGLLSGLLWGLIRLWLCAPCLHGSWGMRQRTGHGPCKRWSTPAPLEAQDKAPTVRGVMTRRPELPRYS